MREWHLRGEQGAQRPLQVIGGDLDAIAAFEDEELNRVLDLDGEEEFVIYLLTVGKKR